MVIYEVPNATDLLDLETTYSWINNTASAGLFFPLMMLTIWTIAFVGSIAEGREASRAWIFANFISIILSIILGLLGWIQPMYIYFFIILLALGLIWVKLTRGR